MSGQAPTSQAAAIAATDPAAIHREAKNAHVTAVPQIGPRTQLCGVSATPSGYARFTTTAQVTATATSARIQRVVSPFRRMPTVNKRADQAAASGYPIKTTFEYRPKPMTAGTQSHSAN